ncbi:transposase family protein [Streptomyces sp. 3211]|uniref:transposase family protein n=1 Tax=Streptomyces sp. 3211 TaxID=1964449 RepID=UPI0009A4CF08
MIGTCIHLGTPVLVDLGHVGAGGTLTDPRRRQPHQDLTAGQQPLNRAHARLRYPVEHGISRLKTWKIFRQTRCNPNWLTQAAKAISGELGLKHRCTSIPRSSPLRRKLPPRRIRPVRRGRQERTRQEEDGTDSEREERRCPAPAQTAVEGPLPGRFAGSADRQGPTALPTRSRPS